MREDRNYSKMDSVSLRLVVMSRIIFLLSLIQGIHGQGPCEIGSNNVVTLCYSDSITIDNSSAGYFYVRPIASLTWCECTASSNTGVAVNLHVTVAAEPPSSCDTRKWIYHNNNIHVGLIKHCSSEGSTTDVILDNSITLESRIHTDNMCLKFEVTQGGAVISCEGTEPAPPITGTVPSMTSAAVAITTMTRKSEETTRPPTTTQPVSTTNRAQSVTQSPSVTTRDKGMTSTSMKQMISTTKLFSTTKMISTTKLLSTTKPISTTKLAAQVTTSEGGSAPSGELLSTTKLISTTKLAAQVTTSEGGSAPSGGMVTAPSTSLISQPSPTGPPSTTGQATNGTNQTTPSDDEDSGSIWENNKEGILAGVVVAGTIIGVSLVVYCVRGRKKTKEVDAEVERQMMESRAIRPTYVPLTAMSPASVSSTAMRPTRFPSMEMEENPIYDGTDANFDSNINYGLFQGKQGTELSGEPDPPTSQHPDDVTGVKNQPDTLSADDDDRPVDPATNPEQDEARTSLGDSGQDSDNVDMVVTNMTSLADSQRDSFNSDVSN